MKGELSGLNEEDSWKQFKLIHEMASENNFEHYEISNFAKKGFFSKHNSNYWNNTTYLGLGPSAHSFNGYSRQWNYSNLNKYIQLLSLHKLPCNNEMLSKEDKANEYLLTKLRTNTGINFDEFQIKFGEQYFTILSDGFKKYLVSGHARKRKNFGFLTLKGWFISDRIIADLMIVK
jgi:oxygen-independent coproporphyrinogen-3 oxidase